MEAATNREGGGACTRVIRIIPHLMPDIRGQAAQGGVRGKQHRAPLKAWRQGREQQHQRQGLLAENRGSQSERPGFLKTQRWQRIGAAQHNPDAQQRRKPHTAPKRQAEGDAGQQEYHCDEYSPWPGNIQKCVGFAVPPVKVNVGQVVGQVGVSGHAGAERQEQRSQQQEPYGKQAVRQRDIHYGAQVLEDGVITYHTPVAAGENIQQGRHAGGLIEWVEWWIILRQSNRLERSLAATSHGSVLHRCQPAPVWLHLSAL